MPSGPGTLTDAEIAAIVPHVPPPVATFLLTSETRAADIIKHHSRVHTNTIQLVDALADDAYPALRAALPSVKIVQVVHVTGAEAVDEALRIAPLVDALLLDSGNPNLSVKQLGGTGRTHDWQLSRRIVDQSDTPVFLAGGLNAENVQRAIAEVQPHGVDLCSGIRANGRLDERKLAGFFQAVGR